MKRAAAMAAIALVCGFLGRLTVVPFHHLAGYRALPGACQDCDTVTAQATVDLIRAAQAAAVSSATR